MRKNKEMNLKDIYQSKFNIDSFYNVEIIYSLKVKLQCSLATTYRTIKSARIPILFLPHKRSQVIIHGCSLWKLANTPAWRKYIKTLGYKSPSKRRLDKISKFYNNSDLVSLFYEGWFKPLSLSAVISAVECGLIPVDDSFNIPVWFIASIKGLASLGLPCKTY